LSATGVGGDRPEKSADVLHQLWLRDLLRVQAEAPREMLANGGASRSGGCA
jgi:hypothetical protein